MVKIGDYQVVFSQVLLVPEHETIEINYDDEQGTDFKLLIKFEENINEKKENGQLKSSFRVEPHEDSGLMIFTNWKSLGTSIQKPIKFGNSDSGKTLNILAHVSFSGELYRANIQLMLGEPK